MKHALIIIDSRNIELSSGLLKISDSPIVSTILSPKQALCDDIKAALDLYITHNSQQYSILIAVETNHWIDINEAKNLVISTSQAIKTHLNENKKPIPSINQYLYQNQQLIEIEKQ